MSSRVPDDSTSGTSGRSVVTDVRFAPIPEDLLYDTEIDPLAVRVYGCLMRHGLSSTNCYPSHARIANLLGLSKRSVARPLQALEERGWIGRTARFDPRGDRLSDQYEVRSERAAERTPPVEERVPPTFLSVDPPTLESAMKESHSEREQVNEIERVADAPPSSQVVALCRELGRNLADRGYAVTRDGLGPLWLRDMDRLLRIDGRAPEEVLRVIRWLDAGQDEVARFWRTNVRSPATLRQKWVVMAEQDAARQAAPARNGSRSSWLDRPGKAPLAERLAATLGTPAGSLALTPGDDR